MLIEAAENYPTEELYKVAKFITDFLDELYNEKDTSGFNPWIWEFLESCDDNFRTQDASIVT